AAGPRLERGFVVARRWVAMSGERSNVSRGRRCLIHRAEHATSRWTTRGRDRYRSGQSLWTAKLRVESATPRSPGSNDTALTCSGSNATPVAHRTGIEV